MKVKKKIEPLVLVGEVDEGMTTAVFKHLYHRQRTTEDVLIFINSIGGDSNQSIQICNLIKSAENRVTIHAMGECSSAATTILCAADVAVADPGCLFMIHYGSASEETPDDTKYNKRLRKLETDILTEKVKVSRRTVSNWMRGTKYLSAEEALEVGLVDEVRSCLS